jgi:hypothetical protein
MSLVSLNYNVQVTTISNRSLTEKEWEPIARRIAKAVKGRSKKIQVTVWADVPFHLVAIDHGGRMTVRKGGLDIAFKPKTTNAY